MPIVFPHANGYALDLVDFVAAWISLVEQFGPKTPAPLTSPLPRRSSRETLSVLIANGDVFCAEYLCRLLVPSGYRNTAQATNLFLDANQDYLVASKRVDQRTGRTVSHVSLSASAIRAWHAATNKNEALADAEALFELADDAEKVADVDGSSCCISLQKVVEEFVVQVGADPYQPIYRKKPVPGTTKVIGWKARHSAYFWPRPSDTISVNNSRLRPIRKDLTSLAKDCAAGNAWSSAQEVLAVKRANDVFKWGGVPQVPSTVTWQSVRAVMECALTGCASPSAPMNSGWTKVAALATEHKEKTGSTQVIWDSRVATSIIKRVDGILKKAKCIDIPQFLNGLGTVPGRGGTRPVKGLRYKWPSAYGRWDSQFAGSKFVRLVRDELNASRLQSHFQWTTRDVEMVLFSDGY